MICGSRHIFNRMRTDSFTVCAFKSQSFKKPQNLIPFLESIASKIKKTSFGKNILQKNVALKKITEIEPTNELWAEATLAVSRNLVAPFFFFFVKLLDCFGRLCRDRNEREWVRVSVWVCERERESERETTGKPLLPLPVSAENVKKIVHLSFERNDVDDDSERANERFNGRIKN